MRERDNGQEKGQTVAAHIINVLKFILSSSYEFIKGGSLL